MSSQKPQISTDPSSSSSTATIVSSSKDLAPASSTPNQNNMTIRERWKKTFKLSKTLANRGHDNPDSIPLTSTSRGDPTVPPKPVSADKFTKPKQISSSGHSPFHQIMNLKAISRSGSKSSIDTAVGDTITGSPNSENAPINLNLRKSSVSSCSSSGRPQKRKHFRGHIILPTKQERLCSVCSNMVNNPKYPSSTGQKCDLCKASFHNRCREGVKTCRDAKEEEYRKRLTRMGRGESVSSEDSFRVLPPPAPPNIGNVDPVYFLLKQAKEATVAGVSRTLVPIPNIIADNSVTKSESSLPNHESAGSQLKQSPGKTSAQISPSQLLKASPHTGSRPPHMLTQFKQMSMDSQYSDYGSDTANRYLKHTGGSTTSIHRRQKLMTGRHLLAHSSIDTDDSATTSIGSPCLSGSESLVSLSRLGQFVVLRSHDAKTHEELSIKLGEKLTVLEATDPLWWQARRDAPSSSQQASSADIEHGGLVPASCLAKLYPNENVLRVKQDIQVSGGPDNNTLVSLVKDQIVFGQNDNQSTNEHLIRTQDYCYAKCPAKLLSIID